MLVIFETKIYQVYSKKHILLNWKKIQGLETDVFEKFL